MDLKVNNLWNKHHPPYYHTGYGGNDYISKSYSQSGFSKGAFDSIATYMTVGALSYYAIGLVGTAAKFFLSRVFYSLQDTKTPMINSFIALGINIVLNFALINFMQHRGLALATSISAIATSLFLPLQIKRENRFFWFYAGRCMRFKIPGSRLYYGDSGVFS